MTSAAPSAASLRPRAGRRRRFWTTLVLILAVLVASLFALWFFVLPGALRGRLADELERFGFEEVAVDDVELRADAISIGRLAFGGDARVELRGVRLAYSLSTVLALRFDRLDVAALHLRLAERGASSLDGLIPRRDAESKKGASAAILPDPRVARIAIAELSLEDPKGAVPAMEGALRARFDASRENRAWQVDADLAVLRRRGRVELSISEAETALARRAAGALRLALDGEERALKLRGPVSLERADDGGLRAKLGLEGEGGFDLARAGRRVRAQLEDIAAEFELDVGEPASTRLRIAARIPAAAPLDVSGELPPALRGMRLHGGVTCDMRDEIVLRIRGGELWLPDPQKPGGQRLRLRGIEGAIALPRAQKNATSRLSAKARELSWTEVHLRGGFSMGLGSIRTRFDRAPFALEIEGARISPASPDVQAAAHVAASWITLAACRIDSAKSSVDVELGLENVDVQSFLRRLAEKRFEARVRVSGKLPLRLQYAPRPHLSLLPGASLASTGPGRFLFARDSEANALLAPIVDNIMRRGVPGREREVREHILGALRDFAADRVSARVIDDAGEPMLVLLVSGRGREVPQKIDADLNIRGVQDLLDLAFELHEAVDKTRKRVEDKIDGTAGDKPGDKPGDTPGNKPEKKRRREGERK